jgi:serine/threonine protein kinase
LNYGDISEAALRARCKYLKAKIAELNQIRSDNIIEYLHVDKFIDDGVINVAMEYVPGGSLRKILDYFCTFKERLVKIYTIQILQGLYDLHKRDIVHGDLKLNNVYVDDLGVIKLADFGFLKQTFVLTEKYQRFDNFINQDSLNNVDDFQDVNLPKICSENHTPPEVVKDPFYTIQPSYDIWCLGLVIYEMLSGKSLFSNNDENLDRLMDYLEKLQEAPKINLKLSEDCLNFLKGCLNPDPKARLT